MKRFIRTREEFEQEVILLFKEGWTIRGLSKHFEIGRNTIRRILRAHHQRRNEGHDLLKRGLKRKSLLESFEPMIKKLLEKYPKISGVRLLEELKAAGYTGGITILREHLKKRRKVEKEPEIRFETSPGLQAQMDWSPYTISFKRTGKMTVQCFSYILGFSRRHYIDFTTNRVFHTLIRRHQDAFAHFNGVPKQCLYDSEKTVVLRWEAGQPVFNPAYTAFITHYNCRPIVCRPHHPQTKGKIEAPFRYVEGNLLCGRDFQDLEDLRAVARWWLNEKSDRHIHDTTKRPPIELFIEQEQAALDPLPLHPYDTAEVALVVCRPEGLILFETNWYSVPSEYIADILSIKATEHEILIYSPELTLLTRHDRVPAGSQKKVEKPEHARTKKVRYGLEPVREAFLALGPMAEEFLKGLTTKLPKNCGFHARYILHLKESYQCDDIHQALSHASRYQAFDGKAIERILRAQATPRTLESVRNERASLALEQVLPQITQRSLDEYSPLLDKKEEKNGDDGRCDPDPDQKISDDPETLGNPESA